MTAIRPASGLYLKDTFCMTKYPRILENSEPGGGGVLPLWPDRGVQSGLKRAKTKILKNTLKSRGGGVLP